MIEFIKKLFRRKRPASKPRCKCCTRELNDPDARWYPYCGFECKMVSECCGINGEEWR